MIVETVKQAEDGDGIVIRLYEAYGKRTRTAVEASILAGKQLWTCGCMENRLRELKHDGERAEITVNPTKFSPSKSVDIADIEALVGGNDGGILMITGGQHGILYRNRPGRHQYCGGSGG